MKYMNTVYENSMKNCIKKMKLYENSIKII